MQHNNKFYNEFHIQNKQIDIKLPEYTLKNDKIEVRVFRNSFLSSILYFFNNVSLFNITSNQINEKCNIK